MKIARISVDVVTLDRNAVTTRDVAEDALAADLETAVLRMETECGLGVEVDAEAIGNPVAKYIL